MLCEILLEVAQAEDVKLITPGLAQENEDANQVRIGELDLAAHMLDTFNHLNAQKLPNLELPRRTLYPVTWGTLSALGG